jgi:hypothetical protein
VQSSCRPPLKVGVHGESGPGEKDRLVDVIAATVALLERLRSVESQLAELDAQDERNKAASRDPSFESLRRFALDRLSALPQLAKSNPELAKAAISKHMPAMVLPGFRGVGCGNSLAKMMDCACGGQGRNRTADASLFRAVGSITYR